MLFVGGSSPRNWWENWHLPQVSTHPCVSGCWSSSLTKLTQATSTLMLFRLKKHLFLSVSASHPHWDGVVSGKTQHFENPLETFLHHLHFIPPTTTTILLSDAFTDLWFQCRKCLHQPLNDFIQLRLRFGHLSERKTDRCWCFSTLLIKWQNCWSSTVWATCLNTQKLKSLHFIDILFKYDYCWLLLLCSSLWPSTTQVSYTLKSESTFICVTVCLRFVE